MFTKSNVVIPKIDTIAAGGREERKELNMG